MYLNSIVKSNMRNIKKKLRNKLFVGAFLVTMRCFTTRKKLAGVSNNFGRQRMAISDISETFNIIVETVNDLISSSTSPGGGGEVAQSPLAGLEDCKFFASFK